METNQNTKALTPIDRELNDDYERPGPMAGAGTILVLMFTGLLCLRLSGVWEIPVWLILLPLWIIPAALLILLAIVTVLAGLRIVIGGLWGIRPGDARKERER